MRFPLTLLLVSSLYSAPLQCAGDPETEPGRYETPPEALYDLAGEFKDQGERAAWKSTLEYLIRRYPSSRFARMARTDLGLPQP